MCYDGIIQKSAEGGSAVMKPEKKILLCRDCTHYLELFYEVKPHAGLTGWRFGFCKCCGRLGLFRRHDLLVHTS